MATEKELKLAKETYDTLCNMLDARNWKHEKDDEKLIIHFGVGGDDLPMAFAIFCDAERQLIRLISFLPFNMSKEKIVEGAIATSLVNYYLSDGSFDFNLADGSIVFKLTSSFRDSLISEKLFEYMIDLSCVTVDKYNDQFLMMDKGKLSIEDFIKNNF